MTFSLRPAQQATVQSVAAAVETGSRDTTVALLSPGAGKSLTAVATHVAGWRNRAWTHALWLVPRLTLAAQAEQDWHRWTPLLGQPLPGGWLHRRNHQTPTPPGTSGHVTTYQSAAQDPDRLIRWIKGHRALLVCDEAQWLGADDRDGTAAAEVVDQLRQHAAHMLLMTGTPYRADGAPLVGALDHYRRSGSGRVRLHPDVSYTYRDGVSDGVLRPIRADLWSGTVAVDRTQTPVEHLHGSALTASLRSPHVWQPLVGTTIRHLTTNARPVDPEAVALVLCPDQKAARQVHSHIQNTHPQLRVGVAVSDDDDAHLKLQAARQGQLDVLVAVGMCHVGYDCPSISVVCLLTNVRQQGWLEQAVGRGLRMKAGVPADQQVCWIIAPGDAAMLQFVDGMRRAVDKGTALRDPDPPEGVGGGGGGPGDLPEVSGADLRPGWLLGHDPTGQLDVAPTQRSLLDPDPATAPAPAPAHGVTVEQARQEANREVARIVTRRVRAAGGGSRDVASHVAAAHRRLNRAQKVSSSDDLTSVDQCLQRVELAQKWAGR